MKTVVPHRADLKKGFTVNNKYTVIKTLGEGAFGSVYKVKDYSDNEYALKMLRLWDVPSDIRQPLVERFNMEFQTGQIESRYLVQSLDYGMLSGNPYIVMEYCPGGDLNNLTGKESPIIAKASSDILHGLYDLHVNGKVHRDLKPENVLFKEDGTAALTDFGISGDRNKRMTERNVFGKPNQIFGTYAYMPPEQVNRARGMATVLPTTDIFSFGVVIYQLLTGKLPFGKLEDQNDLVNYQKKGKNGDWDRESLLRLPDGNLWLKMIEGCLKPEISDRLQSAKDTILLLPRFKQVSSEEHERLFSSMATPLSNKNHFLKAMHGDDYGTVYNLAEIVQKNDRLLVYLGREKVNDIILYSPYASRMHCTIESDDTYEHWKIRDGQWNSILKRWISSSNGTYVNSRQITQDGFWLESGDIITIGDDTYRYE